MVTALQLLQSPLALPSLPPQDQIQQPPDQMNVPGAFPGRTETQGTQPTAQEQFITQQQQPGSQPPSGLLSGAAEYGKGVAHRFGQRMQAQFQPETQYADFYDLTGPEGQGLGRVLAVSKGPKLTEEDYTKALQKYVEKHENKLKKGEIPVESFGNVRIFPTKNIVGQAEGAYQRYLRPFIQTGLQETGGIPEPVANFLTPENLPQAAAMTVGGAGTRLLKGTLGAATPIARTLQRAVPAIATGGTYAGALTAEGEPLGPAAGQGAVVTGISMLSNLLVSKLSGRLNERAQRKLVSDLSEAATQSESFRGTTVNDILRHGYTGLRNTMREGLDSTITIVQPRSGYQVFDAGDVTKARDVVHTVTNDIRSYLQGGRLDAVSLIRDSQQKLTGLYQNLSNKLGTVTTLASRSRLFAQMLNSSDPQMSQFMQQWVTQASQNPMARHALTALQSGKIPINPQQVLRQYGATRQQLQAASDKLWDTFQQDFSGMLKTQFDRLVVNDVQGAFLLHILRQGAEGNTFNPAKMQKYLVDNGAKLQSRLQHVMALMQAAFRGGAPGVQEAKPVSLNVPTPFKIGPARVSVGGNVPGVQLQHYPPAGAGVPLVGEAPTRVGRAVQQAISPLAIRGFTGSELRPRESR